MTQPIIEIVTYNLASGVSVPQFLKTAETVNRFLDQTDGFVQRHLSVDGDGVWTDHIEWQSLKQAQSASEKLMSYEPAAGFLAAIDEPSARMSHNKLELTHK